MLRENKPRRRGYPEDSQAHVHRRRIDGEAVLHLHSRVADCEDSIEKLLVANQQMTEHLKMLNDNIGRVAEVLEAWNNAKGFWATLKFMSAVTRIVIPVIAFFAALMLLIKTGQWIGSIKP